WRSRSSRASGGIEARSSSPGELRDTSIAGSITDQYAHDPMPGERQLLPDTHARGGGSAQIRRESGKLLASAPHEPGTAPNHDRRALAQQPAEPADDRGDRVRALAGAGSVVQGLGLGEPA